MIALVFLLACTGEPATDGHAGETHQATDGHPAAPEEPSGHGSEATHGSPDGHGAEVAEGHGGADAAHDSHEPGPRQAHAPHPMAAPVQHDSPAQSDHATAVRDHEAAKQDHAAAVQDHNAAQAPHGDAAGHGPATSPDHGEAGQGDPPAPTVIKVPIAPVPEVAPAPTWFDPEARPVGALRRALVYLILGAGLLVGLGLGARSVVRRRPHLAPEIADFRFGLTLLAVGWAALSAVSAAQVGGPVVSLGGLATAVVVATAFGIWWVPRYLEGMWQVLQASKQTLAWVECNGVVGQLGEVGALRVRLRGDDGMWTSVPISAFGGAIIRGATAEGVRLSVDIGDANVDSLRLRATVSPFRDPGEPVVVDRTNGTLTVRCWSERAAGYLDKELRALR